MCVGDGGIFYLLWYATNQVQDLPLTLKKPIELKELCLMLTVFTTLLLLLSLPSPPGFCVSIKTCPDLQQDERKVYILHIFSSHAQEL